MPKNAQSDRKFRLFLGRIGGHYRPLRFRISKPNPADFPVLLEAPVTPEVAGSNRAAPLSLQMLGSAQLYPAIVTDHSVKRRGVDVMSVS